MIYFGDISKQDFVVLKELAERSSRILEFGVGASTQVISNFTKGEFITIDTSPEWIETTKQNIEKLKLPKVAKFEMYHDFKPDGLFGFVFDDGIDGLRREFGLKIWKYIVVGGCLAYHDTRRTADVENVLALIREYHNEISIIEWNKDSSNITLVWKKHPEPWVNWNRVENRTNGRPVGYENF